MNRIVIIGNGFDLAHGLKTRYEDFLLFLINESINYIKKEKSDCEKYLPLFKLWVNPHFKGELSNFKSILDFQDSKNAGLFIFSYGKDDFPNFTSVHAFEFQIKSDLFSRIFKQNTWSDIERSYFMELSRLYNSNKTHSITFINSVKILNNDFEFLKLEFIKYIQFINSKIRKIRLNLNHIFGQFCNYQEIDLLYTKERQRDLIARYEFDSQQEIFLVDFNYTETCSLYTKKTFIKVDRHFQIHGNAKDSKSIIFGYGDEMDSLYKKLEDLNSEEVLKHFKVHHYFNNEQYSTLLNIIKTNAYDVVVIGHSMGLSDRILLNSIFENDNCKAIHLYHTGGDSHFRKRIACSRHFDDKKKFREKLVEENPHLIIHREN